MAGQPPEPWQSSEQDQARPAWQSYSPPAGENQDSYAYQQSGRAIQSYGQQGGYGQQSGYAAPPYTSQDPALTAQDQAFGDQAYQGPGSQGQQGPHWQAVAGMTQEGRKPKSNSKGFVGSLFDFSFTSFVTPKIIKVLYVLGTVWTVIWALVFLRYGFKYGGAAGGLFTLIVVDPIMLLLTLGSFRVLLELFMVAHRMHDDLKAIRDRGEG